MIKRILKCIAIIVITVILLILALAVKPSNDEKQKKNNNAVTKEQVTEVLSVEEKDKNIIGYLTIEKIGLEKAPIADGTSNKIINKYIGHFENTSYLDGNVCICSHNRGSKAAYFEKVKELKKGDVITYITKYETKKYEVQEIKKIEETDFTILEPTQNNQITLITCVENQRELRLCVVGTEIIE